MQTGASVSIVNGRRGYTLRFFLYWRGSENKGVQNTCALGTSLFVRPFTLQYEPAYGSMLL